MKKSRILLFAVLLFFVPVYAAAQGVPGVTDTEVVVGISNPLSGPAALWGATGLGAKAWADYVNDNGGVHGRKIKVILRDDGYNPSRAMANLNEMKGKIFAATAILGTAVLHTTKDFFPDNKIPLIAPYMDVRTFEKMPKDRLRWIFVSYPDYMDEAEFITNYAVKNLGTKKVSLFGQNDNYGKMGSEGMNRALSKLSGQAAAGNVVLYDVTERAFATHAMKLKESGADTLLIYATPSQAALILKESAKIGYRPKVLTTFTVCDTIMYKIAGPDLWNGVYPCAPGSPSIPGDPVADRVADILKKYEPKVAGKEFIALYGALSMMQTVEGLKNAGRNLTQESMIKGMEMIQNFRPEGMGAPITYGPDRRHGLNASRLTRAENGKHVPVTDYAIFKPLY